MTNLKLVDYLIQNYEYLQKYALKWTQGDLSKAQDLLQSVAVYFLSSAQKRVEASSEIAYLKVAIRFQSYRAYRASRFLRLGNVDSIDYTQELENENWVELQNDREQFKKVMAYAFRELPEGQLSALTESLKQDKTSFQFGGKSANTIQAARFNAVKKLKLHFVSKRDKKAA